MAKHVNVTAVPTTNTLEAPKMAEPAVVQWSISDAWSWLGHAWRTFIHVPHLGLLALVLVAVVLARALHKSLR